MKLSGDRQELQEAFKQKLIRNLTKLRVGRGGNL